MSDEYKSEKIKVKVKRQQGCVIKLEIEANTILVQEAKKLAIKEVNKEISLPGFRKGKAPEELLLKQHSPKIEQIWQKKIADLSFIEAQKLIKLYPLNSSTTINFDLKKHSLEEGAELTFSYETEPDVPVVDPQKFQLKEFKKPVIDDAKTDEAIKQAQFFYATWTETNNPIKKGDFVILDLESLETDPPQLVFSKTRFEMKEKSIAKWMQDLLIGAKKGDVLEGISKPDDDLPEEEKKKFDPKKVRVTILKVEEATLPEVDDSFAQKLGVKTVEEMRKNISSMLLNKEEEQVDLAKKEEINKFLLSNYPFDLPSSLITSEIKYRKDQMLNNPSFKKKWDKMTDQEKKTVEETIKKQAQDAVSLFYLCRKIVQDNKIDITQKEINEEVMKTIQASTPLGQTPNFKHIPQEVSALCFSKLMMAKAQENILAFIK